MENSVYRVTLYNLKTGVKDGYYELELPESDSFGKGSLHVRPHVEDFRKKSKKFWESFKEVIEYGRIPPKKIAKSVEPDG